MSLDTIELAVMVVVPTVTDAEAADTPRTPVKEILKTVGTSVPVLSGDVTLKGSVMHPGVSGLVMLQTTARPPGPGGGGTMKISGCAATTTIRPRMTVPLLFMTMG